MALENQQENQSQQIPPQMGRTIVSSSTFSNVANTKNREGLNKSKFSFVKGLKKKEQLEKSEQLKAQIQSNNQIANITTTLVETNKILVQIQQQLEQDYSNRIAEKKKLLEISRRSTLKQKAVKKEAFVERGKPDSGKLGALGSQILAPTKNIFDKIFEFLSIVATGIVINNAWKWLQDPENRQKIVSIFLFLKTYWKELLAAFVTYKLIRTISKLVGFANSLRKIFRKLRGLDRAKSSAFDCSQLIRCLKTAPEFTTEIINALIKAGILATLIKSLIPDFLPSPSPAPAPAPSGGWNPNGDNVPWGQQGQGQGQDQRQPDWGPAINALKAALVALATFVGYNLVFRAEGGTIPKPKSTPRESRIDLAKNNFNTDSLINVLNNQPKKKCNTCSLLPGFARGGTISGDGKDTVPAMLAPGEEVIRASAARRWRPLLKDINDNDARMWQALSNAIEMQSTNNKQQIALNADFSELVNTFNKELDAIIQERKIEKAKKDAEDNNNNPEGGPISPIPSLNNITNDQNTIPAMLSSGEEVISTSATSESVLHSLLNKINEIKTQKGQVSSTKSSEIPQRPPQILPRPRKIPEKIYTYFSRRKKSTSDNKKGEPTVVNMTLPPINAAGNQSPQSPPSNIQSSGATPISIMSFDTNNPYISESLASYGIFV